MHKLKMLVGMILEDGLPNMLQLEHPVSGSQSFTRQDAGVAKRTKSIRKPLSKASTFFNVFL